jgi:hypothetical protein
MKVPDTTKVVWYWDGGLHRGSRDAFVLNVDKARPHPTVDLNWDTHQEYWAQALGSSDGEREMAPASAMLIAHAPQLHALVQAAAQGLDVAQDARELLRFIWYEPSDPSNAVDVYGLPVVEVPDPS